MNYTYLPSSPYSSAPVIVMTTNPASRKMTNLVTNPNVSLLVHDCEPPLLLRTQGSAITRIAQVANLQRNHRGLPPPTDPRPPTLWRLSRTRAPLQLGLDAHQPQHVGTV